MVAELQHVEVLSSLSSHQLLVYVEVLQYLIACVDIDLNAY